MSTLLAIGLVLLAIVIHEWAHLAVIKLLGYNIRGFYIGVPVQIKFQIPGKQRSIEFSTILFHLEFGAFRVGFSWLLLGGAVITETEEMTLRQRILMYVAGPATNFMAALVVAILALGLHNGWEVTSEFLIATVEAIKWFVGGQIAVTDIGSPVAVVQIIGQTISVNTGLGLLFSWLLLNVSLAATNMLPIPALDGGQCVMSILSTHFGQKGRRLAHILTTGFFYVLVAAIASLTMRDLILVAL